MMRLDFSTIRPVRFRKHYRCLFVTLFLFVTITCAFSQGIDGINFENYPRVDGSTSTLPLNTAIASYLLHENYDSLYYKTNSCTCNNSIYGVWGIPAFTKVPVEYHFTISDVNGNLRTHIYPKVQWGFSYNYYLPIYLTINGNQVYVNADGQEEYYAEELCHWNTAYCDTLTLDEGEYIAEIDTLLWCYGEATKYNPGNIIGEKVKSSQTHNSFINLIDGTTDIIISARKPSDDELQYANSKDVTLLKTAIALDALIFLKNKANPVSSITHEQIRKIYRIDDKPVTNWSQISDYSNSINPFVRNENSGSQELFEEHILHTGETYDAETEEIIVIPSMGMVYIQLAETTGGVCFTVYYYHQNNMFLPQPTYSFNYFQHSKNLEIKIDTIVSYDEDNLLTYYDDNVQTFAVNDIYPQYSTIKDNSYPYVSPVYALIRSDLPHDSMAHKMYEWLQTAEGKTVIESSGYIATPEGYNAVETPFADDLLRVFQNPAINIISLSTTGKIELFDIQGKLLREGYGNSIDMSSFSKGIYLLKVTGSNGKIYSTKIIKK